MGILDRLFIHRKGDDQDSEVEVRQFMRQLASRSTTYLEASFRLRDKLGPPVSNLTPLEKDMVQILVDSIPWYREELERLNKELIRDEWSIPEGKGRILVVKDEIEETLARLVKYQKLLESN